MAIVETLIYRPEQAVELVANVIEDNAERLGIGYVGRYDERLLPHYPAVVVSADQMDKEVHATHTFAIMLRCSIWVYHAKLTITHKQRSKEDLELATALVALLEDDKTFNDKVVFAFCSAETPGIIQPRSGRGEPVVGTRLSWQAATQQRW